MRKRFNLCIISICLFVLMLSGCNTDTNSARESSTDANVAVESSKNEDVVEDITSENVLTTPSNEQIMEALIEYSNEIIAWNNESREQSEEISNVYFFEDGKYASKIYSGSMVDETSYRCIVETTRTFNLVNVTETLLITLTYEKDTDKWSICDKDTIRLTGDWKLVRYWTLPDSNAVLSFSEPERIYDRNDYVYEMYSFNYTYGDISYDGYLKLPLPTSSYIYSGSMTGPDGTGIVISKYVGLDITPDSAWYTEYELENHARVDEATLGVTPTILSTTGIIDMSTDDTLLPYMDAAKEIANVLFLEQDVSKLTDMYLVADDEVMDELRDLSEYLTLNDIEVLSATPYMGEDEDVTYNGITPIVCYIFIELSSNDIYEYWCVGIGLYELDGQMCLLGVDI